jgi:hypothetical protein
MLKPQQKEFLIEMQHRLISCVVCCENMVNIEVGKLRCGREQYMRLSCCSLSQLF